MSRLVISAPRPSQPAAASAGEDHSDPFARSNPFADRQLMARAGFSLLLANVRYWTSIAPLVRTQLSRWERHAQAIGDPLLRRLAIGKLRDERFNVEVAATLATLAPRAHRASATEAIVALQVMYDYLDLLTEQPAVDPLTTGRRLFAAFTDALTLDLRPGGDYYGQHPRADDGGYLTGLVEATRDALARLPGAGVVAAVARHSAERCAEAQVLSHAAARSPSVELKRWSRREASGTGLQWPEFLAGATASVLAVHALIAAAADRLTTSEEAEEINAVYLSIGALTMIDSLIDRSQDVAAGEAGYVQYYESRELMATRLGRVAREGASRARGLAHGTHHIMTLVGVAAYYISAPAARGTFALPVTAHLRRELRPLITPTLALMRAWRMVKRVWRGPPVRGR